VAQSDKGFTKYFSTWLTWSVHCQSWNRKPGLTATMFEFNFSSN
jgi:hypothetical protein